MKQLIDEAERIRSDLPEAQPILKRIDEIIALAEARHAAMHEGQVKYLTHPSQLLMKAESAELHRLKLSLRQKTPAEARTDILRKRLQRINADTQDLY